MAQPYLAYSSSTSSESHIAAIHQGIIPNWKSPAFAQFVDACGDVVDELANAQTTGNGREEMMRCEGVWRQVVWLWERRWPGVLEPRAERLGAGYPLVGVSRTPVVVDEGSSEDDADGNADEYEGYNG